LLDKHGYYPFDEIKGESVSRTLECAYDDWCAGIMARQLGFAEDAAFFLKRSENWRNVFDASIGLVRGKDSNGKWREPYDPYTLGHGADKANDFTEGNAFQYTWHVMQNPQGLVDAMGGRDAFVKKLDSLFEAPSKTEGMGEVLDVTGLIGQYVQGNEPSHHVIYFYPQVGHPEKAAERIREVFDKFYLPKPDGLCGNDDCGQMSAWYIFSAMGFYPFNPCGGEYVLGAPQVDKVTLSTRSTRSARPNTFTIIARNLSKENKYVKSVTLNGKPITDWKIRHSDIVSGGELVFEMCPGDMAGHARQRKSTN
jgi:predicted alpha-1,2-mannosidase